MAIVFVSIQLLAKFMAIISPAVRGWRVSIDLMTKASAIAIIGFLLRTREYVVLGPGADVARFQKTIEAVNYAMYIGWKVVIVILSLQLVGKLPG
jgi:hypothetical protein